MRVGEIRYRIPYHPQRFWLTIGGATAIKTHLNACHRATGTTFGSCAQERPFFEELAKLGCPLLVMAGQDTVPSAEEMDALK